MTEAQSGRKVTRREALKLGAAAVIGLGAGVAGLELLQGPNISSLNNKVTNLTAQLSSVQSQLTSANSQLASAQGQLAGANSALATSQSQAASQPFYLDAANKQIVLQATVNNAAFTNPTVHSIVWDQGKNASIAMFNPTSTPEELYNGLIKLGATPGNTVQLTSAKGTLETGTPIKVYVTWPGAQKYTLQQLIKNYDGTFVFGGNLDTNKSLGTGCETCLQSCAVGITSSGTIGWLSGVGWTLDSTIVPQGQAVTIYIQPQL